MTRGNSVVLGLALAMALGLGTRISAAQQKINLSTPEPEPVEARTYHIHDGFYLRASIGLGAMDVHYDVGSLQSTAGGGGLSLDVMIGGSPSRGMAIGGALLGDAGRSLTLKSGGRELGDVHVYNGLLGPFIDGFPNPKDGWHMGGMLGFATQDFETPDTNKTESTTGFGGAAWGGYDAWVGDEWSVGGLARVAGAVTRGKDNDQDIKGSNLSIMLMFTALYH